MDAWGKRVDEIEEELDDLEDHLSRCDILEAVWAVVVIERGKICRWRRLVRFEWVLNRTGGACPAALINLLLLAVCIGPASICECMRKGAVQGWGCNGGWRSV